jgi:hypothetical protein
MRGDFNGAMTSLAGLAKISPIAQGMLQSPDVIKDIVEQILRLYNMPNKQPYLEGLQAAMQKLQEQAMMQQQMAQQGMAPGQPGPPGAGGPPNDLMALIQQHAPEMHALLQANPQGGVQ